MAEEGKGIAMAILGIVAVIAVVGLVLLFTGATGKFAAGGPGTPKIYTRESSEGYAGGPADVENPYYGYEYETYGGVTQSRTAVGDRTASGGNWGKVYGENPYETATQPGVNAGPTVPSEQAPTYKRAPQSIPSGQNDACGGCPYGSACILDQRRVPSSAEAVPGYDGCYVISTTY